MKPFVILAVVIACCACLPSRVDAQADPRQNLFPENFVPDPVPVNRLPFDFDAKDHNVQLQPDDPPMTSPYDLPVDHGWLGPYKTGARKAYRLDPWAIIRSKPREYRTAVVQPHPGRRGQPVYRVFGEKHETFADAVRRINVMRESDRRSRLYVEPEKSIILKPSQLLPQP
jgi:hypothetical protein